MTNSDHLPQAGNGNGNGKRAAAGVGPSSGTALFTFDADKRIRSWNKAAESLTGFTAEQVVGHACWEVLCSHDAAGGLICHAGCSFHRLLGERWPVATPMLVIKTAEGTRRVQMPMVVLEDRVLFAALMLDAAGAEAVEESTPAADCGPPPALTQRQREVLAMLAGGKAARAIAGELRLSELTVRNHIRAILRELSCNSQLSAVAKARQLGLV